MKMALAVLLFSVSSAIAAPAKPAPDFLLAFFDRPAHHLSQVFSVPIQRKSAEVLGLVYKMLQEEEPSVLQPVFADNGFVMEEADIEAACREARSLLTMADLDAYKAEQARLAAEQAAREQAQREEIARKEKEAQALRERQAEEARLAAEQARIAFDNERRANAGLKLKPEEGGMALTVVGGGGSQGGKGVGSYGIIGRYGMPLADGKLGNIGPEFGFIHTMRYGGKDEDLGSQVVYTSSDGEYKVTDWSTRELKDKVELFSLVGASYQTPSVAHNGRKAVNFEFGSRLGVGHVDDRRIRTDGEREEMIITRGGAHWETMSDTSKKVDEGGHDTTGLFYTAFAAANVFIVDTLSLRLEFERYFLDNLRTQDATVGRAGVQFKF